MKVGSKVRVLDPPPPTPPIRIRGYATVVSVSSYFVVVETTDGRRVGVHPALVRGPREPNGAIADIPFGHVCTVEYLPREYVR